VCTASDLIRRRRRRWWLQLLAGSREADEPVIDYGMTSEPDLEARQALQGAQAILESLPVKEKVAFSLRRLEGMELKQVAMACDCSLATIKRRIARAEERFTLRVHVYPALEKWLAEKGGEET
jgi:RNA polymerase sigma-70 factor, ECF subfamily